MEIRQRPDGTIIAIEVPEGRQAPEPGETRLPVMTVPDTWDPVTRTMDVVLVDERTATVRKFDWQTWDFVDETLSLDAAAVRLDRLNNGAPLLMVHNSRDPFAQIGKFLEGRARIEGEKPTRKLVSTVGFSPHLDEARESVVQEMADGFRRHLSVGFDPHVTVVTTRDDGPNEHEVIDWTPLEGSVVPIGADDNATTRSYKPAHTGIEERGEHMDPEAIVKALAAAEAAEKKVAEAAAAAAQVERQAEIQAEAKRLANEMIAARQERNKQIRKLAKVLVFKVEDTNAICKRDESLEVLSAEMIETATKAQEVSAVKNGTTGTVTQGDYDKRDIDDLRMVSYLFCHRYSPAQAEKKIVESLTRRDDMDARHVAADVSMDTLKQFNWRREGSEYLGYSLLDMAKRCLERDEPGCTRRKSRDWIARRALNTTSGFTILLQEAFNISVDAGFVEVPLDARWSRRTTIADFRLKHNITMGETAEFLPLGEDGELISSTIREKEETYRLETVGRSLALTRELIINDQFGGLTDLPFKFGQSAVRHMRGVLYGILTGGLTTTVMTDGEPLFSAIAGNRTFNNINAAGVPSIPNINLMRVPMATRPGLGNVDEADPTVRFLMRFLICAEKFIDRVEQELGISVRAENRADGAGITSQIPTRLRGLQPIADPLLDAFDFGGGTGNGWITTDGESVEHAFLEGSEGMQVNIYSPEGKLGTRIDVHIDFGAGAVEQRGVQLNPGAAS